MIFQVNIQKNHEKNVLKKHMFFACVFYLNLGGFGRGFGKGLALFWRAWGHFWRYFLMLVFFIIANRGLGGSWGGL